MRYRTYRLLAALLIALAMSGAASAMSTFTLQVGGAEQAGDSGTITISFSDSGGNYYSEAVTYGAFSTPASIAAAFGGMFSNQYLHAGLCVHASGSVIIFQLKNGFTLGQPTISGSSLSFSVSSMPASPMIIGVTPNTAPIGTTVIVNGQSFGDSQGTSTISVNGTLISVASWSNETITFAVPTGASSGNIVITVNGMASNAVPITITALCHP